MPFFMETFSTETIAAATMASLRFTEYAVLEL